MLFERWLRHPKAILIWAAALVVAGAWAALRLPVEWAPSVELPAVSITASWPGASPRAVERSVAAPLERALRGIPGTARVESQSREGQAFLRLEVAGDRGLGLYIAEVADRLAAMRRSLPERVIPRLSHEVPEALRDEQGFMTLQLVGAISPMALRRLAEETVEPRLRAVPGVAGILLEGGRERELLVALDADRLHSLGVSLDAVHGALAEAVASRSFGRLRLQGSQALVWQPGHERLTELAGLVVGAQASGGLVRLADVARISLGSAPVRSMSRVDGKPVVTLTLDRASGSHLLETAAGVESALRDIRRDLAAGVELLVADDRSQDVRADLRDLALRGGLALLSIVAVLVAMLGGPRSAAAVLGSVAAALALALLLMAPLGLSLNLLTLAGLSLLVGLLVDNATVVVAQLRSERRHGCSAGDPEVARRAVAAVWLPLLGCTVTTATAFLPMVYLSGELRSLFAPFAVLAASTLVFSFLSAVFLVPLLAGLPAARRSGRRRPRGGRGRGRGLVLLPYQLARRFPRATLALLFLGVGLPTSLLPDYLEEPPAGWETPEQERRALRYNQTLGSDAFRGLRGRLDPLLGGVTRPFLENVELGKDWSLEERPEVQVVLRLPAGSGIERADELIAGFEREALASPAVARTLTRVIEDAAWLRIRFREEALATAEPLELRNRLIGRALSAAGLTVAVSGLASTAFVSGIGDAAGIAVEAFGPSYEELEAVAASFARRLRRDGRVAEVDIHAGRRGQAPGREALYLRWGPEAVARTGMSAQGIAALLRSRLSTWAPTLYAPLEGDPHVPVRIVMRQAERQELDRLLAQPLDHAAGTLRLAGLAPVHVEREPPAIERLDQQYRRFLQIHYRGPARMGRELVDREIRALRVPPGYRLERPAAAFSDAAEWELLWVIAGTIGLVFLVIAAVLESWRLAAWVLLGVPMAWIGVALGFLASGESFAEGAFLGSVLTIGVAVSSGILLADRYHRLQLARPRAAAPRLALLALRNRLRPLWTTTLTAITGMLPVLLLPGAASFWRGLAVTVAGGLLASTLLAPAAMVALLSWRFDRRRRRSTAPRAVSAA